MKVLMLALGATLLIAGSSAAAAAKDLVVLDLTNWGEGIYYLQGRVLGTETNGKEGFQDAPQIVGNAAGDAIVLP